MGIFRKKVKKSAEVQEWSQAQILDLGKFLGLDLSQYDEGRLSEITYFACLKTLSEAVAKLPLTLQRVTENGGVEDAVNSPFYNTVRIRPNPYMTPSSFWEAMENNRNHYGNAYARIIYGRHRVELYPLSSGDNYQLQEISAPAGYECDSTIRHVIIDSDGTVTIEGAVQDNQGRFVITNPENGTITVYKVWDDDYETNEERRADGIEDPLIVLTTDVRISEATFTSNLRTLMLNLTKDDQNAAHVDKIKAFKQYTRINGRTIVEEGIANGTVIRADDGTTDNNIYIWLDENGTLYWWSDARNVYFPKNSSETFRNFTNMSVFDTFGLNFSRVQYMNYMFRNTGIKSINFRSMNLSSVKQAIAMLAECSKLETADFSGTDFSALETVFALEHFNSNNVGMFWNSSKLKNADFSGANLSSLNTIRGTFCGCTALESVNFSDSIFSENALDMSYLFQDAYKLKNVDFSNTNRAVRPSNVLFMFSNCKSLETVDLTSFDTSSCRDMSRMFNNCTSLVDVDLSSFDTTECNYMYYMFNGCSALEILDLSSFSTLSCTDMMYIFNGCTNLSEITVDNDRFDTSSVKTMKGMFSGCKHLTNDVIINLQLNTSSCTDMSEMFSTCTKITSADVCNGFDTSNVKDMTSMFYECSALTEVNKLRELSLSQVKYMNYMFRKSGIENVNFSNMNLSSVKQAIAMLAECSKLETADFSGADLSALETVFTLEYFNSNNVGMFWNSSKLKNADFSGANLSSLNTIRGTFNGCTSLESADFSNCTFGENALDMGLLFKNAPKLIIADFSNIIGTICPSTMYDMFNGCKSLETVDLTFFDTTNCTSTASMFYGCSNLETVVVSATWTTTAVTSSANMFSGCTAIRGKNDTTYDSGRTDKTYARVDDPENGKPGYFTDVPTTGSGRRTVTVYSTSSSAETFTFISTDEEHCYIDKTDPRRWVYTFKNIETGREYFAREENADTFKEAGYEVGCRCGENGRLLEYKGYIEVSKGENTIVNSKNVPVNGSLKIKKLLDEETEGDLNEFDYEKSFVFTLNLTDENSQPVSGRIGSYMFTNGTTPLSVKADSEITVSDIPAGYHYSVTEIQNDSNYTASIVGADEGVIVAEGEILEDITAEVVFKNTKKHVDIVPASFTLKKVVTGAENNNINYSFSVSLQGLLRNTTYKLSNEKTFTTDENGKGYVSVSLKNGESVVFNVPNGTTAIVTEQPDKDSIASYKIEVNGIVTKELTGTTKNKSLSTQTIEAKSGADTVVTFTNQRTILQSLKIKKTVPNATDGNNDSFHFNLRFKKLIPGLTPNFKRNSMASFSMTAEELEDGVDFDMKNGDEITIEGINVDAEYRILESKSSSYISAYKMTDAKGLDLFNSGENRSGEAANTKRNKSISTDYERMDEGEEVTVEFINTKATHDIIVKKAVEVLAGEITEDEYKSKEFSFTVELEGLDKNKTYIVEIGSERKSLKSDGEGRAEYTTSLKHGEQFKIMDLPVGATYTITEAPEKFYAAAFEAKSNDNGAVIELASKTNNRTNIALSTAEERVDQEEFEVTFTFTNTYSASGYVLPSAGMDDKRPIAVTLVAGMLLFAAAYWFVSKRQKHSS